MERTIPGADEREQLRWMVARFLELLSAIRPLTTDVGYAYERGEDIPGADVGHLHGIVALRDDLTGLQHYLEVCGVDMKVPGLLVARGDMAELELAARNEPRLGYTPTRPRKPRDGAPGKRPGEKDSAPVPQQDPRRKVAHIEVEE